MKYSRLSRWELKCQTILTGQNRLALTMADHGAVRRVGVKKSGNKLVLLARAVCRFNCSEETAPSASQQADRKRCHQIRSAEMLVELARNPDTYPLLLLFVAYTTCRPVHFVVEGLSPSEPESWDATCSYPPLLAVGRLRYLSGWN